MSGEGRYFTWTIIAGEDLDNLTPSAGHLFKAVALDDGKIADNGREAGGILLYGGKEHEHVTLGYQGVIKFCASEDIEKGELLTVDTGGWFRPAQEGDYIVGRCLDTAVTAGNVGDGAFNFATVSVMGPESDR